MSSSPNPEAGRYACNLSSQGQQPTKQLGMVENLLLGVLPHFCVDGEDLTYAIFTW